MEKPTGVIQKIIESLQQVNALNTYSPIEKDIILHNLRAAYMIFLNITTDEQSADSRIEKLFEGEEKESRKAEEENPEEVIEEEETIVDDEMIEEEVIEEEPIVEEEPIEEEEPIVEEEPIEEEEPIVEEETIIEEEPIVEEEQIVEDEQIEEEKLIEEEEQIEEEKLIEEEEQIEEEQNTLNPYFQKAPLVEEPIVEEKPHFQKETSVVEDDILEFIPDAKPHSTLLFDDMMATKPEKKSLNDLLTEKKEDNSLGAKFQQSYIPDLTKAIAINEKFTFIRELFHNSGVNFSNAIQKLNECDNIESAFALMEELKHQYLWDTTSSSYLSLCDLVRRRFV